MPVPATPTQVFEQLIGQISSGDPSRIHELYAEDARVEVVFAPGAPRGIQGREQIRKVFAQLAEGNSLGLKAEKVKVHQTADPEVVIAEFDYRGLSSTNGNEFTVSNIQVLRVRDGLIIETRDYHDHLALAVADGRVTDLAAVMLPHP